MDSALGRLAPTEHTPLVPGAGALASRKLPFGLTVAALARLVTCGSSLAEGYNLGIFSVCILPIAHEFGLGPAHISLLAGAPALAMTAMAPISGMAIDRVGRKPVIAAGYLLMMAGSLAFAEAHSLAALVLARSVLMVGCQVGFAASTVYMAEVSPSKSRGMLVSLEEIFINIGFLASLSMGRMAALHQGNLTWRSLAAIGAVVPLLCLALLAWPAVPESARFLHLQGRSAEARQLLQEALAESPEEVAGTLRAWAEEEASGAKSQRDRPVTAVLWEAARLRSVMLACGLLMVKSLSGHSHLGLYLVVFMSSVTSEADAAWWATLWQGMKVVALIPTCFLLMDRLGRRPLLMASAAGCTVSLFVAALTLELDLGPTLLGTAFVVYAMAFSAGLGPVSHVYVSEVVPQDVRGTVMGAITVPPKACEVLVLSFILPLFDQHRALPFLIMAIANLLGVVFFSSCPETKGQVLEDIQQLFHDPAREKAVGKVCWSQSKCDQAC